LQIVATREQSAIVDPANGNDEACGESSRTCATLKVACERYSAAGTTISLVSGIHLITEPVICTARGIRLQSVGGASAAASTIIDCATVSANGGRCISFSNGETENAVGIILGDPSVLISHLTIRNGSAAASEGGCLYVAASTQMSLQGVTISRCSAQRGGAIAVKSQAILKVVNSQFEHNSASMWGGSIFGDSSSMITIIGSRFSSGTADQGGAFAVFNAALSISATNVSNCKAADYGGGAFVSKSSLQLDAVRFVGNNASLGGALSMQDSTAKIVDSVFLDNVFTDLAGAIYSEFSEVYMRSCHLEHNIAAGVGTGTGAGFYCLGLRATSIVQCSFLRNQAKEDGGAIAASYCNPDIYDTSFVGNTAGKGGAVSILAKASTQISGSTFINNSATQGGAISLSQALESNISSSLMEWNSALQAGGAMFIEEQGGEQYVLDALTLQHNAARSGGAIYFDDPNYPILTGGIIFHQNSAVHGPNVASGAMGAEWVSPLPFGYEASSGKEFDVPTSVRMFDFFGATMAGDNTTSLSVATGQSFSLIGTTQGILDQGVFRFGTPSEYQNGSATSAGVGIRATPSSVQHLIVNLGTFATPPLLVHVRMCIAGEKDTGVCEPCPVGYFSNASASPTCFPCLAGSYQDLTGQDHCELCPEGTYSGEAASKCLSCIEGTFAPQSGAASCLPCQSNAISSNRTKCLCNAGYLAVPGDTVVEQCVACPGGADCTEPGTSVANVLPLPGFWPALNAQNRKFVKCINSACLGTSASTLGQLCSEGYTGNLCTECAPGFGRTGEHDCSKCPDPDANRARVAGVGLGIMVLCSLFTYSTIKAALEAQKSHSVLLKITLSCFQFNAIAASFDFRWPGFVKDMLDNQQRAANVGSSLLSVDCFLAADNKTSPFYIKSLVFMFLPVMVCLIPALVFGGVYLLRKSVPLRNPPSVQMLRDYYFTTVIVILFMLHPSLTQQTFMMLNCKTIGADSSDQYLVADMREQCFGSTHLKWVFGVCLPMLFAYVIGIPAAGLKVLYNNRTELTSERVKKKYSFLFKGYEQRWYFWEMVVVFRKVALVIIAVFFAFNTQLQAIMAVLLVSAALMAHVFARPYENSTMDWMEFFSLINSFATFWAGQLLFVDGLDNGSKVFISVIIVVLNFGFFAVAAMVITKEFHKQLKARKISTMVDAVNLDKLAAEAADINSGKQLGEPKPESGKIDDGAGIRGAASKPDETVVREFHLPDAGGHLELATAGSMVSQKPYTKQQGTQILCIRAKVIV